jgi:lysophospholipase L1-like esterase
MAMFSATGRGWANYMASIPSTARVSAFIWFQGESDPAMGSSYGMRLADLAARVRAAAHDPALLIVVCQLKAVDSTSADVIAEELAEVNAAIAAWARSDPHALWIRTDDLPFEEGYHMTGAGYQALAARIVAAIR